MSEELEIELEQREYTDDLYEDINIETCPLWVLLQYVPQSPSKALYLSLTNALSALLLAPLSMRALKVS